MTGDRETVEQTTPAEAADTTEATNTTEATETVESTEATDVASEPESSRTRSRVFAFGVLPAIALVLLITAGVLKWQEGRYDREDAARVETTQAARDIVTRMLSYEPDRVDQQLAAAADGLTGSFRETYTRMSNDIVIPRAKENNISAVTTVPGAAVESVEQDQAVVMLFVNQQVSVGGAAPTDSLSTARVTLDKVGDRWLVSEFETV